jgi:hypothetical protein
MSVKKNLFACLLIAGVSLPFSVQAGDLIIHNFTKHNSTTKTNKGYCSTEILGSVAGTTKAGETKPISEMQLKFACIGHLEDCVADVYMADNCGGDIISTVNFSVTTGIKGYTKPKYGYMVTVAPNNKFDITITGGPAAVAAN